MRVWAGGHIRTLAILAIVTGFCALVFTVMTNPMNGLLHSTAGLPQPPSGLIGVGGDSGYWDTPCADVQHCPSPVPAIDRAAAASAVPLIVPALRVRVDHVGHYSIPVGTAVLPNGVLTRASMTLADNIRPDLQLDSPFVDLVLVGEDGRRLVNVYEQGWREGTESVDVTIEFDVVALDGPTTLELTDIEVR